MDCLDNTDPDRLDWQPDSTGGTLLYKKSELEGRAGNVLAGTGAALCFVPTGKQTWHGCVVPSLQDFLDSKV